jgi:aminoglycoside phosphotransferase (APT) family kinase protein
VTPPENTRPPKEAHRLNEASLAAWLGKGPIEVRKFKGGQSNPTYWIGTAEEELVLRKKPPGKLLPSAHAVEREYRVMRALRHTNVPVPEASALCEDDSVIGTPFFVMRYVPGRLFWDATLPEATGTEERRAIYRDYVRVLAAIHQVDFAAVGLGDYGKQGGFVARQVERWSKQYQSSQTSEIPAMNALMAHLAKNVPAKDETALIHGDYRLDNLLYAKDSPRVAAVIDWELSTLGHPLSDLAYACMGYRLNLPGRSSLAGVDVSPLGIPTEDEVVAEYCRLTGRDRIDAWPYFMAFGVFRLAAIAQGVYKRGLQGNASSDETSGYGDAVKILAELGCSIVGCSQ